MTIFNIRTPFRFINKKSPVGWKPTGLFDILSKKTRSPRQFPLVPEYMMVVMMCCEHKKYSLALIK